MNCPHCGYNFNGFEPSEIRIVEVNGVETQFHDYPCADEFLAEQERRATEECRYILAKDNDQIESYIGFGAYVVEARNGRKIVAVPLVPTATDPETNVKWNLMRLMSGLHTAAREVYPTLDAARARADLGY